MAVDLTHVTTFHTQASAHELIELRDTSQLATLPQQLKNRDFLIIGSGSNILFADDYKGSVVQNCLKGIEVIEENSDFARITIAAGEIWHDIVCQMSARGFYGLENLALIPGTMGAAPVQNIGAYGVEIADFIESVEVFDVSTAQMQSFSHDDCQFDYRDSVFKREENRQLFLIVSVTLKLNKIFSPVLTYQGLQPTNKVGDKTMSPKILLERVIAIRQSKLPNPIEVPNAGSFFKNALVPAEVLKRIQGEYPEVPFFTAGKQFKIPTAWLVETAGFKGVSKKNGAGTYEKHALILVNRGNAHGRDIYAFACEIMDAVCKQFGVEITPEVRIIGI